MYTSLKLGFMLELSKYSSVKRGREVFVSFFGHRDFINNLNKEEVVKLMHEKVKGELVRFLLGNYGNFDTFAYQCAKAYKQNEVVKNVSIWGRWGNYRPVYAIVRAEYCSVLILVLLYATIPL